MGYKTMREYVGSVLFPEKAEEFIDPKYHRDFNLAVELARKYKISVFLHTCDFLNFLSEMLDEALFEGKEIGGIIEYVDVTAEFFAGRWVHVYVPIDFWASKNIAIHPERSYNPDPYDVLYACDDILYRSPNAWSIWHSHPDDTPPSCGDLKVKRQPVVPHDDIIKKEYPEDYHFICSSFRLVPDLLLTGGYVNFALLYNVKEFMMFPLGVKTPEVRSIPILYWAKTRGSKLAYDYYTRGLVSKGVVVSHGCPELAQYMHCYQFLIKKVSSPIDYERYFEIIPIGGERL